MLLARGGFYWGLPRVFSLFWGCRKEGQLTCVAGHHLVSWVSSCIDRKLKDLPVATTRWRHRGRGHSFPAARRSHFTVRVKRLPQKYLTGYPQRWARMRWSLRRWLAHGCSCPTPMTPTSVGGAAVAVKQWHLRLPKRAIPRSPPLPSPLPPPKGSDTKAPGALLCWGVGLTGSNCSGQRESILREIFGEVTVDVGVALGACGMWTWNLWKRCGSAVQSFFLLYFFFFYFCDSVVLFCGFFFFILVVNSTFRSVSIRIAPPLTTATATLQHIFFFLEINNFSR